MKKINFMLKVGIVVTLIGIIIASISSKDKTYEQLVQSDINIEHATTDIQTSENMELINNFIKSVDTSPEIILLEEEGEYDFSYSRFSSNWNKIFTTASISMFIDYKAIISIPTSSILLANVDGIVYASYSTNSFEVKSVEVTNKNILTEKDLFAKSFTDDEKIAFERVIINEIKDKVKSEENILRCKDSLEFYLSEFADECGVRLIFK